MIYLKSCIFSLSDIGNIIFFDPFLDIIILIILTSRVCVCLCVCACMHKHTHASGSHPVTKSRENLLDYVSN